MKNVRIDIVSDVVCPWCIIGYRRLEKALDMLADQIQANIHWHPFELNPHMPQGGENLRSHLAGKYGTTLEGSIKARAYESSFVVNGGETGIRTLEGLASLPVFKTGAFDHSAISPLI